MTDKKDKKTESDKKRVVEEEDERARKQKWKWTQKQRMGTN
ncbi:MAG: hypothetical protein ACFE9D_10045 [Promethearchaeota archaeon]